MSTTANSNRNRSPNYPKIDLADAVQRLTKIYETQQRYPASRETFAKLMGYGGLNGASASIVSALSKYGLLEGHGDTLRVSEIGQDLILHRRGDPEFTAALQTAAFMPTFFREMRDQYPTGLPSEHSLRATLIKRGFNPKSIDSAVGAYRETIEYLESQIDEVDDEAQYVEEVNGLPEPQAASTRTSSTVYLSGRGLRTIDIPYSQTGWATLQAAFPLTEQEWCQMQAVLEAMKPALIVNKEPQPLHPSPPEESGGEMGPLGQSER